MSVDYADQRKEQELRKNDREAWQYMLPLLFPLAVLIYLFNFLGPNSSSSDSLGSVFCGEPHTVSYVTKSGDSCWVIANEHGGTMEDLIKMNPELECEPLKIGQTICIPLTKE
jgi:hypothetical protein